MAIFDISAAASFEYAITSNLAVTDLYEHSGKTSGILTTWQNKDLLTAIEEQLALGADELLEEDCYPAEVNLDNLADNSRVT